MHKEFNAKKQLVIKIKTGATFWHPQPQTGLSALHISIYLRTFSCFYLIILRNKRICCFQGGSAGKESACNVGDLGSILGMKNSMDYRAHGITESDTAEWLSLFRGKRYEPQSTSTFRTHIFKISKLTLHLNKLITRHKQICKYWQST